MPSPYTENMAARRVQHIDIESALEARIQFLHSFLDFSNHDISILLGGGKYIRPMIPAVVDAFYKKLLQYDVTSEKFAKRSSGYEGKVDDFPSDASPQIQYRKLILQGYLQKLFSDPSKMDYWEYLDKVGIKHASPGQTSLHVPFIHLGASLGFLQNQLNDAILNHPRLKTERKIALVKAIGKVIWIQNDLFARWQTHDEKGRSLERPRRVESEGYLHGKDVLAGAEVPLLVPETPAEELSCPFERLMR